MFFRFDEITDPELQNLVQNIKNRYDLELDGDFGIELERKDTGFVPNLDLSGEDWDKIMKVLDEMGFNIFETGYWNLAGFPELEEFFNKTEKELIVLFAKNGESQYALEYASNELKADREFVKEFCSFYAGAFIYADEKIRGDRKFIKQLIRKSGSAFEILRCANDEINVDEIFLNELVQEGLLLKDYREYI
jgi:hypothetical protein